MYMIYLHIIHSQRWWRTSLITLYQFICFCFWKLDFFLFISKITWWTTFILTPNKKCKYINSTTSSTNTHMSISLTQKLLITCYKSMLLPSLICAWTKSLYCLFEILKKIPIWNRITENTPKSFSMVYLYSYPITSISF